MNVQTVNPHLVTSNNKIMGVRKNLSQNALFDYEK